MGDKGLNWCDHYGQVIVDVKRVLIYLSVLLVPFGHWVCLIISCAIHCLILP